MGEENNVEEEEANKKVEQREGEEGRGSNEKMERDKEGSEREGRKG